MSAAQQNVPYFTSHKSEPHMDLAEKEAYANFRAARQALLKAKAELRRSTVLSETKRKSAIAVHDRAVKAALAARFALDDAADAAGAV